VRRLGPTSLAEIRVEMRARRDRFRQKSHVPPESG